MTNVFDGIAATTVNILTSVLGVLLNAVVCAVVLKNPSLRTNFGILMCNLALSDFLLSLLVKPLLAATVVVASGDPCVSSPDALLRVTMVFGFAFSACSMGTLFLLSVDRCLCVVFPIRHSTLVTRARIKAIICVCWLETCSYVIIAFCLPIFRSDSTRIVSLIGLAFCYVVIVMCYSLIFMKIRKQNAVRAEMRNFNAAVSQRRERKLAMTIALVVTVFTCSWAPLAFIFYKMRRQPSSYPTLVWGISVGLTNSVINPVLYFFRSREYRNASKRMLSRCCRIFSPRRVESTETARRKGNAAR